MTVKLLLFVTIGVLLFHLGSLTSHNKDEQGIVESNNANRLVRSPGKKSDIKKRKERKRKRKTGRRKSKNQEQGNEELRRKKKNDRRKTKLNQKLNVNKRTKGKKNKKDRRKLKHGWKRKIERKEINISPNLFW